MIPIVAPRPYPSDSSDFGYPLDQHAPLWPLIGGLGSMVFGDIFLTFKIFTLVAGILVIPVSYLAFKKPFGEGPAILASGIISFTYLLIDYSGNGSLYIVHALLFLVFVLVSHEPERLTNAILLGFLAGLAYLLNYQAVIVIGALVVLFGIRYKQIERLRPVAMALIASLSIAFLVISPWLMRNYQLFGAPFFSVNYGYVLSSLGVPSRSTFRNGALVYERIWSQFQISTGIRTVLVWILRNGVYFIIRILILAPVTSIFAFLISIHLQRRRNLVDRSGGFWSVLLLLGFHVLLSCLWPVFKFRYFVPVMPLIIGLGSFGIYDLIRQKGVRIGIIGVCIVGLLAVNILTYVRVPSHTNYYDSNELFHWRTGEVEWREQIRSLRLATQEMNLQRNGTVIGDIPVFYFTHAPIVRAIEIQDQEIIQELIKKYDVSYVVDVIERESFYGNFIPGEIIYRDRFYMVMEIEP
jgi:4-amino-4-deoxy-L-arabinose transferase-like glycosyltransferase